MDLLYKVLRVDILLLFQDVFCSVFASYPGHAYL